MNTRLEKLFEKHDLSEKDKYEINQIFCLLPNKKQINILNNFDVLAFRLKIIQKQINLERKILIWDLFTDIKLFYHKYWDQLESL